MHLLYLHINLSFVVMYIQWYYWFSLLSLFASKYPIQSHFIWVRFWMNGPWCCDYYLWSTYWCEVFPDAHEVNTFPRVLRKLLCFWMHNKLVDFGCSIDTSNYSYHDNNGYSYVLLSDNPISYLQAIVIMSVVIFHL